MPTSTSPLPKEVQDWLNIRMLGEPYVEAVNENGRLVIKRGYLYNGVKYYEKEVLPRQRLSGECDVCGNHTLECTCNVRKSNK